MRSLSLLILILSSLFIQEVNAQFEIGIKSGYTRAWENYGDVIVPDDAIIHVNKFHINALAYLELTNFLKIGIEPGYAQRGAACVPGWIWDPNPIFASDTKLFLNYIELPLMVSGNMNFFKEKLELFGKAGYGASFLASAFREEIIFGSEDPPARTSIPLGEFSNMNRWDHGIYSAVGVGVSFGSHKIFTETSYYAGLANAERFNTSKNRSLSFSLGYMISL